MERHCRGYFGRAAAGIPDENIRFICGLGNHGTANRTDFVRKLGEEIVSRYMVFNHNPFIGCKEVGTTTTWGTKVEINEELMQCDLKIALGVTCPHPIARFGGGTKAILPCVTSYQTTVDNHANSFKAAFAALEGRRQHIVWNVSARWRCFGLSFRFRRQHQCLARGRAACSER